MTRLETTFVVVIVTLAIALIGVAASADTLIDVSDLPFEYSFSKEYVVMGERTVLITITNNTHHYISAIEIEVRLRDAFNDVVSDWNAFSDPDMQLAPGQSRTLGLKLTRQSILGSTVENVMDKARYVDIRYTRVLLGDGTLLRQDDLYPELLGVYGSYRITVATPRMLGDGLASQQSLSLLEYVPSSVAYSRAMEKWGVLWLLAGNTTLSELTEVLGNHCVLVRMTVTNVSQHPVSREWMNPWDPSPVSLIDDLGNQYSSWALVFAPQPVKSILDGDEPLYPGSLISVYYVFDKVMEHTPQTLTVYIDNEEYLQELRY